jgi:sugar phosphate isomerase/epimerase
LRVPFKRGLRLANQLGVDAVEIDARGELKPQDLSETGLRELRKMLEDLDLRVSGIGFQTRRGYDAAEDLDRRVAATKATLKFAHALRAPVVINQIGRVPEESSGPEWNMLVDALRDVGTYGQQVGATLAARTGSESGADLARLIAALPAGSLVAQLDPGNLIINGFSAQDAVTALGSHISHVYAKDGVRDLARGRGIEVPLGRGVANLPELLGSLDQYGFAGYVTIARENADDPLFEVGEAVKYLRSL